MTKRQGRGVCFDGGGPTPTPRSTEESNRFTSRQDARASWLERPCGGFGLSVLQLISPHISLPPDSSSIEVFLAYRACHIKYWCQEHLFSFGSRREKVKSSPSLQGEEGSACPPSPAQAHSCSQVTWDGALFPCPVGFSKGIGRRRPRLCASWGLALPVREGHHAGSVWPTTTSMSQVLQSPGRFYLGRVLKARVSPSYCWL